MSDSISEVKQSPPLVSQRRPLLIAAWAIAMLLTVPQIIVGAILHQDFGWIVPANVVLLAALLALTLIWSFLRPLRGLILIFLVIYGVEGWLFGPLVQESQWFTDIFNSGNLVLLGGRLMRIAAVLVMLLVLVGMGFKRQDFFLRVGNLRAVAEPERWGIRRKPENWLGFGTRYALIIVTLFLVFMVPSTRPSLSNFSVGLVLFAALCAAMNAFGEEFLYRSALLPQVLPLFGKGASMILVASWFGMGHYFGVPQGSAGVIMTTIGGWIFAKSMVETRGMGWALILHFVSDFTIYMVILLAGGF